MTLISGDQRRYPTIPVYRYSRYMMFVFSNTIPLSHGNKFVLLREHGRFKLRNGSLQKGGGPGRYALRPVRCRVPLRLRPRTCGPVGELATRGLDTASLLRTSSS